MTGLDVAGILAQLTLEEKASLCLGSDFWHTAPVERLGIPAVMVADGPHGLRKQPEEEQAGLSGSNPATCFPTAAALASSWDVDLLRRVGEALGREAQAEEVGVLLGPGVNIKRSPLCGRNFEYFSEDPLLAGTLGSAFVQGVQCAGRRHLAQALRRQQPGDRPGPGQRRRRRAHAARDLPAGVRAGRHRGAALDRDVLLQPGQRHARLAAPVAAHHGAARGVGLRRAWWSPTGAPCTTGSPRSPPVSTSRCRRSSGGARSRWWPQCAPATWTRPSSTSRSPGCSPWSTGRSPAPGRAPPSTSTPTTTLAREAAHEAAVLLKNDGGLLPLELASGQTLAVLGEFARTPRYQGAGSSQVNPTRLDVPLDALRAGVPDGVEVSFAPGFGADASAGRGGRAGRGGGRDRGVPRPPLGGRVRGLRPRPHGPPGRAAGAAAPGHRGQRAGRRRAGQRLRGRHLALAGRRRRDPRVLAVGTGGRGSGRRPPARRGLPERPAGRDHPGAAGGQQRVPQLPGGLRPREVRRGRVRRLPRSRPARPGGRLPVRPRADLHDLRPRRARRTRVGEPRGRRPRGDRLGGGHQHRVTRRPGRWSRSTSTTSSRR